MEEINLVTSGDYTEIYKNYIKQNKPCLFSEKFTQSWLCRKEWTCDNKLNTSFFRETFGHLVAPVVDCSKQYFSAHECNEMTVSDFCDYWENRNNKILYLKDWHCQQNVPHVKFYEVPSFFSSDWLNEFWDTKTESKDDYRFVYIGVKGSWTPFHADVFHSFSWSANVCGLKKWYLYPPGQEDFLRDKYGKLPFDVTMTIDENLYPNWSKATNPIIVYQRTGEIIFVPSGWHHQVFNLEDTVSINHNWVNACCIEDMFHFICQENMSVKKEICDLNQMDGFYEQCQLILKTSCGIDFNSFYEMLLKLIKPRLIVYKQLSTDRLLCGNVLSSLSKLQITSSPKYHNKITKVDRESELKHLRFDLLKLHLVLKLLLQHKEIMLDCMDKEDLLSEINSLNIDDHGIDF